MRLARYHGVVTSVVVGAGRGAFAIGAMHALPAPGTMKPMPDNPLEHYCSVCEKPLAEFLPYGRRKRIDACPHCGCLGRHRTVWLFLASETNLLEAPRKRILHIAPEPGLRDRLAAESNIDYVPGDIDPGRPTRKVDLRGALRVDLTAMPQFEDGSFDAVYCSHVLEHIPDDLSAIREIHRVLKPGGWSLIVVPVRGERTDEDPDAPPEERAERFGFAGHVRHYGTDVVLRLERVGFEVQALRYAQRFSAAKRRVLGLPDHWMHFCRKRE